MDLHEYQAKKLLKGFQVEVQDGYIAERTQEALESYQHLSQETGNPIAVVKAQIHAGGRGKGTIRENGRHGVSVVKNEAELRKAADELLGGTLVTAQTGEKGKKVYKILIAKDVYNKGPEEIHEFYLSILMDRTRHQNVIIYSRDGGMDIETIARETPDKIFKEWIHPMGEPLPFQIKKMAFNLGLKGELPREFSLFIKNLYTAFIKLDASLIEINPLLKTSDNRFTAVDAKVKIDDNALYRHPEIQEMLDITEEDPEEVEAGKYHLNFIRLQGNVGCMVNGAGLAMATMDMIKLCGGEPANFLDVGGTANSQTVEAGFRIIMSDPNVKIILVNIFGGIVRCDRVASGIIEACKKIGEIPIPVIIRLEGTNAAEAKQLIKDSGLKVYPATELREAAELVSKLL